MQQRSCSEIDELKELLREGKRLRGVPVDPAIFAASNASGLAVPIAVQKERWACRGARRICSLLPKAILESDFAEVVAIDEHCVGGKQVVTRDASKDFEAVGRALAVCADFLEWLLSFDEKQLDAARRAEFYFGPLEAMVLYAEKEVIPRLCGLEDGKTLRTALLHLYGRVFPLARSLVRMNDLKCCQFLAAGLRSMLELYIDMALLRSGMVDHDVEKFFSFTQVYKYRAATNLARIDGELKRPREESAPIQEYLENEKEIAKRTKALWGKEAKPSKLQHWSQLPVEERARRAGTLELYGHVYYYGNMYVHSGYVDRPRTPEEAHVMCAHAYALTSEMFKEGSELLLDKIEYTQKEEVLQELQFITLFFGYFQIWKGGVARGDGQVTPGENGEVRST